MLISIRFFRDGLGGLLSVESNHSLSSSGLFSIFLLCYGIVILCIRSLGYR